MTEILQYHTSISRNTMVYKSLDFKELIQYTDQKYSRSLWVIDRNVADLIQLNQMGSENQVVMESGEQAKALQRLPEILDLFESNHMDKDAIVIVVGGGALTDMVGFVASIYKRGIHLGLVPTSLLGLVDASIGGKNGLNYRNSKNQLGSIYQPDFITYFPVFLDKLPAKEMANGFAEIIKYAILFDLVFFEELEHRDLRHYIRAREERDEVILRCMRYKAGIISEDPLERDRRKLLNFGHTFGHALESLYKLDHGRAIGLGMVLALKISEEIIGLEGQISERLRTLLSKYELPIHQKINSDEVFRSVMADKKRKKDKIDFVLIRHLGEPEIHPIELDLLCGYLTKAAQDQWI